MITRTATPKIIFDMLIHIRAIHIWTNDIDVLDRVALQLYMTARTAQMSKTEFPSESTHFAS